MPQKKIREALTRASLHISLFPPVPKLRKVACATKKRKRVNSDDILFPIISFG